LERADFVLTLDHEGDGNSFKASESSPDLTDVKPHNAWLLCREGGATVTLMVEIAGGMTMQRCQSCGEMRMTKFVAFYRNVGMLFRRQTYTMMGNLCKACVHKQFWKFEALNIVLGPWGMLSAIVAPIYFVQNIVSYIATLYELRGAETPDFPPSASKSALPQTVILVAVAAALLLGILEITKKRPAKELEHPMAQTQVQKRYDTSLFSVQYPAGARVELKDDRDPGIDDAVTHFYRGRLPDRSWADVDITDFSGDVHSEDHMEVMLSKATAKLFAPGFAASPLTETTLGGLHGYKQDFHGRMPQNGLPLVMRWRTAVSQDRTHVWILQTTSPSDEDLSETDCEKFFDSLKIK
jgi:hypothetical protein